MTASQNISVSITPRQSQATWPKVYASQYDKGLRTVTVTITDRYGSFSIPDGATVTVRGTKPDKTGYEYACTITGKDSVVFTITDQMTVLAGQHAAEIRITDGDGNIIGTGNFWFVIESSPLSTDTAISETQLPLVEQAAQNSETLKSAAETATNAANTAQAAANSASKSAQTAQENAGKVLGAATLVEALTAETQRAKKAEEANSTAIDTETQARKTADEALQKALDAEITRAKAAEGGADISAEATARQAADAELQRKLDTETAERKAADDTASQAIDALSTTLNKTIDDRIAEVVGGAPESFDTLKEISDWISNDETSAAAMSSKISDNANAISGEITRATTAEQTITDNLNAEVTRAKKAEEAATKAVSDETLRAEAAEKANADAITTETTDRKAADTTLQSNLDTEITRAKQAEKDNSDNLTTETTRAEKAETANSDAISALQTKVNGLQLTAATVQAAIDELKSNSGSASGACEYNSSDMLTIPVTGGAILLYGKQFSVVCEVGSTSNMHTDYLTYSKIHYFSNTKILYACCSLNTYVGPAIQAIVTCSAGEGYVKVNEVIGTRDNTAMTKDDLLITDNRTVSSIGGYVFVMLYVKY